MKTKVLVLSQTAWRNDNSFGASYTGVFGKLDDLEIANVYCEAKNPQNSIVKRHFSISPKMLIKSIFSKNTITGKEVIKVDKQSQSNDSSGFVMQTAKKVRWQILYWARDLLWKLGKWQSRQLIDFIDSVDPDVLFFPFYAQVYTNDVGKFIQEHTNLKVIYYVSDDIYTLKQFSLSPLFWINRFIIRRAVRKAMKNCCLLYVISQQQKQAYERIFNVPCKVLTKGADFSGEAPVKKQFNHPLKIVFTGNIGSGRWKVLAQIARALENENKDGAKAKLFVYSMTACTKRMLRALSVPHCSEFCGGVSAKVVREIQQQADILVHVESFELKERLKTRLSFSTKIVDYENMARCIFAVGPSTIASMQFFADNDCGVVACNKKSVGTMLSRLINNNDIIKEYAIKAWECGRKNNNLDNITRMVLHDINKYTR